MGLLSDFTRLDSTHHESISYFLPYIACLSFLSLISYVLYIRFYSSLAKVPGPFWASLSRWWLVFFSDKGNMHRLYPRLHEKYGKLVRVGPNEVSVADLDAIQMIYGMAAFHQSLFRHSADASTCRGWKQIRKE